MLLRTLGIAIAAMLLVAGTASGAAPQARVDNQVAQIGFDPPLRESLRYRWEKTVQQDGKTRMSWSVQDVRFEETEEGWRLEVKPVSAGSNETDPAALAMKKRIEELTNLPFVLRLNENAEIVELERGDEFWGAIFKALRDVLTSKTPAKRSPQEVKALEAVLAMFESMPAEVRMANLTESVQPLVTFAGTELTMGSPIFSKAESASPFGGTLTRDVVISLTKVTDGKAHISARSTVPREEFDKLMQAMLDRIGKQAMTPTNLAKMKAGFAGIKAYKHETRADYRVTMEDGLLESFDSTETVEVSGGEAATRRVTTISLARVP